MPSVTSCFNSTLYKKTMSRFWPLWAGYALIWAFILPLNLCTQYMDWTRWGRNAAEKATEWAYHVPETLQAGIWLSALYGLLSAMAVFGYLYASRSTCMMHALPMRRDALFATQYLAGLSFALLPQTAVALLTLAAEMVTVPAGNWITAFEALGTWFLCQSAIALFFFSFAAFCAMFTGHSLALPVFYGILNILVVSVYELVCTLMRSYLYGYDFNLAILPPVKYCTPVYALADACTLTWSDAAGTPLVCSLYAPLTVAAYAVAGTVFALLALLVYRERHAETAGDVVSIPLVKPLFRCGVSFCSGLFFGTFTAAFFGWSADALPLTVCVIVWAVIGCFAAEMLLQKSFRVWKSWPWAAGMAAAMLLLCGVLFLDLFGVVKRVPRAEDVASLHVYGNIGYPQSGMEQTLDRPEDIQKFIDLHQAMVNERKRAGLSVYDGGWDDTIALNLEYTLKNGSTLCRRYYHVPIYKEELDQEGSVTWAAERALQDQNRREAYIASFEGRTPTYAFLEPVYNRLTQDEYDGVPLDSCQKVWQAARQDYLEGTLGAYQLFDDGRGYGTRLSVEFSLSDNSYLRFDSYLTPDARHTLAVLEELGVLEDYAFQTVNGEPVL